MRGNRLPKAPLLERIAQYANIGLKGLGIDPLGDRGWRSFGGGSGITHFGGSDVNWAAAAGDPIYNRVVSICAQYIFDKVVEPRIHVVYENDEGMLSPVHGHPCTKLLIEPNPTYHGNALQQAMALSYKLNGNAYVMKVRGNGGAGVPVELYYIPHWLMWPIPAPDGGPVQFYAYKRPMPSGGFKTEAVPKRNVIHLRNGLDPCNPLVGMSQLRAQCRSICTDNEIDNTLALVLRNRGNIGTIISPASSELELDDFQIEELKRKIGDQTTGDARGGMIGLSYPVKVDQTTQSPKDLQLNEVGSRPEASICAALGIHPMAVNLGEDTGKGGQYGAKYETVAGQTYDQAILPTLAAISEALTYQLLVDFPVSGTVKQVSRVWSLSRKWVTRSSTAGSDAKGYRVNFDYSDVRELGEAADAIHKRAGSDFQIYMTMTLDESREMMGMNPASDPEVGNKYLFQLVTPTLPGIVSTTPKGPEPKTPAEEEDDFPEEEDEEDGQDA